MDSPSFKDIVEIIQQTIRTELKDVKKDITEMKKQLTPLTTVVREMATAIDNLGTRVDRIERNMNIVCFGIPETKPETKPQLLNTISSLFKSQLNENPLIDDVFRIGPPNKPNRPILIKFVQKISKDIIMARSMDLWKSSKISLRHDLTKEEQLVQKKLREHARQMKGNDHGISTKIRNNVLLVFKDNKLLQKFKVDKDQVVEEKS